MVLPRSHFFREDIDHKIMPRAEWTITSISQRQLRDLRAQLLWHGLAHYLDFVFVLAGRRKVVGELHPQPRLLGAAERLGQPDRHLRADSGLAIDNVVQG